MAKAMIMVWMPNQPQAMMPRKSAGMLAPNRPKLERKKTGKGMPYLVPAKESSTMGSRTMRLPKKMVKTVVSQSKPAEIMLAPSIQVGTHTLIPTHIEKYS